MSTDHNQQPSALPTESSGDGSGPSPKRIGESPSKHTPEPWVVGVTIDDNNWPTFRLALMSDPDPDGEEVQADRNVIAAAPDLLAAAEIVIAELNARMKAAPGNAVPVFRGLVELYTAVNKAKGLI